MPEKGNIYFTIMKGTNIWILCREFQ